MVSNLQIVILKDIYSLGNPASFGNVVMIKELKLLLHPPLSHFDHLVKKSANPYLGSNLFLVF